MNKYIYLSYKLVSKLKDRAFRMAERRIKDCVKMQQKHHQRMERKFLKESVASDNSDAMSFTSYNSSSTLNRKLPQFNTLTSNMPYSQVKSISSLLLHCQFLMNAFHIILIVNGSLSKSFDIVLRSLMNKFMSKLKKFQLLIIVLFHMSSSVLLYI